MNKLTKTLVGFVLLIMLFVFSCQRKNEKKMDTILEGKATLYVDESILPIVEDEVAVFETEYNAKLHLVSKAENEVINNLFNDTARILIVTRTLSAKELKAFQSKKITPRITISKIPKTILYLYSNVKGSDFQNMIIKPNVK